MGLQPHSLGFFGFRPLDGVGIETKTSGALEPAWTTSFLSCTGTIAYTLADGIRLGQRQRAAPCPEP